VGAEAGALGGDGVFGEGDEGRGEGFGGCEGCESALFTVKRGEESSGEGDWEWRGSSRCELRD
jgi:hypothetical protein